MLVLVTVGKTMWETSIFPDKKSQSYLLPMKLEVRKRRGLWTGIRSLCVCLFESKTWWFFLVWRLFQ
ncbi:DUF1905 domain-containing protein [Patescibacteria group bacterium]|nr:DUF1905 domain-containing protein [Patescibacteria group bacterium]